MPFNTLADVLLCLSRFLPDTLSLSDAWKHATSLASQLPPLICPYSFGFELPLHLTVTNFDFAFCITQPGSDMLAGIYPFTCKSELLDNSGIWPGIKRFCKDWSNHASGLFKHVDNLWLEFRLQDEDARHFPVPFIKIKENTRVDAWLPNTLELLYGEKIPEKIRQNLIGLLQSFDPQIRLFQAGIYNKDGECRVRFCLEGLTVIKLPLFLKSIGIDGFYPFDIELLKDIERICVHIDVGKSIGSTIGIELRQSPEKELSLRTQPEWDWVLDQLEQKKLCLSENNRLLKEFRGCSYEMIYPDLTQFITYRFLYYIKAVYEPGNTIRAKAYFGFVNRPFVPVLEKTEHQLLILHKKYSYTIAKDAVRRGVVFLAQNQLPNGEFRIYIAGDREMVRVEHDNSPFATAFVLYCSRHLSPELFDIPRLKAKMFLLREGFDGYLWKYWTFDSGKAIVPDLDDTCCISFILQELFQLDEVKRNIPAILSNRDVKGLFQTWIKESQTTNDVDIVVNANVLLYLGEREETKTAIAFIKECINKGEEHLNFRYYLNNVACYYAVTRAAIHGIDAFKGLFPIIKKRIFSTRNAEGTWSDELSTALAVCALQNMGVRNRDTEKALLWLIDRQRSNGCWGRSAFYAGPEPPGPHSVWFGSEELTTAFCIEALSSASCTS